MSTRGDGPAGMKVRTAHRDCHAAVLSPGLRLPGRLQREQAAEELLVEGATRSQGAGDRVVAEAPDEHRTCFEVDRDRIVHSKAFRRLAGKCQVFVSPADDHIRTRLTHALEVSQVALAIARPIGLNLALTEAIALGHDCGHGPGGHNAEVAFSPYAPEANHDHALYGADVVLAPLNLCEQTLDGIRTHSWRLAAPRTPEGEAVAWADRIAYLTHDFDDAVRAGILSIADLPADVARLAGTDQGTQVGAFVDAVICSVAHTGVVAMPVELADALATFRQFNFERIYTRPAAVTQASRVISVLGALVEYYADAPGRIPAVAERLVEHPSSCTAEAFAEAVHYVCGMTDRFALSQALRHCGFSADQLPRSM